MQLQSTLVGAGGFRLKSVSWPSWTVVWRAEKPPREVLRANCIGEPSPGVSAVGAVGFAAFSVNDLKSTVSG